VRTGKPVVIHTAGQARQWHTIQTVAHNFHIHSAVRRMLIVYLVERNSLTVYGMLSVKMSCRNTLNESPIR